MFFDYLIFQKINGLAGRWSVLDGLGFFLAEVLIFILAAGAVLYFFLRERKRAGHLSAGMAVSAAGSWLVNQAIGMIFFRFRPFVYREAVKLVEMSAAQKSFPSDHTAVSFAIAFSVFLHGRKTGSVFLAGAFLVGLARIFAGVHYPADVVAGMAVGIAMAFLIRWISDKSGRKKAD